jgi:hypothetical protein
MKRKASAPMEKEGGEKKAKPVEAKKTKQETKNINILVEITRAHPCYKRPSTTSEFHGFPSREEALAFCKRHYTSEVEDQCGESSMQARMILSTRYANGDQKSDEHLVSTHDKFQEQEVYVDSYMDQDWLSYTLISLSPFSHSSQSDESWYGRSMLKLDAPPVERVNMQEMFEHARKELRATRDLDLNGRDDIDGLDEHFPPCPQGEECVICLGESLEQGRDIMNAIS